MANFLVVNCKPSGFLYPEGWFQSQTYVCPLSAGCFAPWRHALSTIGLSIASTHRSRTFWNPVLCVLAFVARQRFAMTSPSKHGTASPELCDLAKSSDAPPAVAPRPNEDFLSFARVNCINVASKWFDNWLGHRYGLDLYKPSINYASSLAELSDNSVEQNNVIRLLEESGLWLAGNTLPSMTRKDSPLEASTKFTYFKAMRQVLLRLFPDQPVLKSSDDGWGHDLVSSFHKMAFRTTTLDHSLSTDPLSLSIYRDITTQDCVVGHGQPPHCANRLFRAKDWGKYSRSIGTQHFFRTERDTAPCRHHITIAISDMTV